MNKKRIISALLILVMVLTAIPTIGLQAVAANGTVLYTVVSGKATKKKTVKAKKIKLNRSSITLADGKSVKLTYTLTPKKTTQKKVTWSTSNKTVAKVNKNGKVTAVKKGTATITVKVKGTNKKAKCKVTVLCNHKYKTITEKSTCVKKGCNYKKCQRCGATTGKTYQKLANHQFTETRVESTCTEDGYVEKKCKKCNKTIKEILKAGHDYKKTTVNATCTADGYISSVCQKCGDESKTILPAGHSYEIKTVPATCKTDGSITKTCLKCGDVITDVIKASGNDHIFTEQIEVKEPTCEVDGAIIYKCLNCSETKEVTLTKLQHDDQTVIADYQNATCSEDGYIDYPCQRKGCNYVRREILKTYGCKDNVLVDEKEATCLTDGYKIYQCLDCGNNHTNVIKATGHDMRYSSNVKATCRTYAYDIYKCLNCDHTEKRNFGTEYKHDGKYIDVHLRDNCLDVGYTEYVCRDCGAIYKKKHEYDVEDWEHEYEIDHYTIQPDCEHTGHAVFKCSLCGNEKEEDVEELHDYKITSSNLQYNYLECKLCGHESKEYNDQEYIIDLGNGETTTVVGHYDLEMADEIVELLNEYRVEKELWKLKKDDSLLESAQLRAVEITYSFSHTRPNGKSILSLHASGENIAKGYSDANDVMIVWKTSLGHNANMLGYYSSVGIGVFCLKYKFVYTLFFVQNFT